MKWLGIILIILGIGLTSFAGIYGLWLKKLLFGQQVLLLISGLPLLFFGVASLFLRNEPERRKKAANAILFICVGLMVIGILSSFVLHIPGGRIELIFGTFMFNFSYIPLLTKARYEKWSNYVPSKSLARSLTAIDMVSIILCVLGVIFAIQKWPAAGLMLYSGMTALAINMIGWNRMLGKQLVLRKEAEDKLEIAHGELKEKHEEIQDSIAYAKRIQSAILPPPKLFDEHLPNSFVLYKPKDVVAGDFYWLEKVEDKVLFAAADCTGHGVPGAMVSVICNGGLNRSVNEFGLTEPGKILDKTREIVIKEFEKSEEEVKDGMDIALCSMNVGVGVKEGDSHSPATLQYAGAHNALWIIRNGATEVEEIKANKQPIGKYDELHPYTTHTLELNSGDSIYIFSDGYVDQFGGEKGKKFKSANFKKLLLSVQNESMEKQKELIDKAFGDWRGNLEQIDDVCVIGVRV